MRIDLALPVMRDRPFRAAGEYLTVAEDTGSANRPRKGGMLVLVSFGFLMLAVVLRVGSVFVGGLTVLYLSITSSAAAAITLVVAVHTSKRRGVPSLAEPPVALPRHERPLWLRVTGRSVGALFCLSGLISIGSRNEVTTYGTSCGSFSEALHSRGGNCVGNARMSIFGLVILAIGFIVLTVSLVRLLRGRGTGSSSTV
ncbi:MAG: hypothetical protein QOI95_2231 [Acidimicrobiaceae bacterium]